MFFQNSSLSQGSDKLQLHISVPVEGTNRDVILGPLNKKSGRAIQLLLAINLFLPSVASSLGRRGRVNNPAQTSSCGLGVSLKQLPQTALCFRTAQQCFLKTQRCTWEWDSASQLRRPGAGRGAQGPGGLIVGGGGQGVFGRIRG